MTSSTPKRQKNRDGSYTLTATPDISDSNLKRKGQQQPFQHTNDPDDPLLAAYNNPYLAHMLPDQGYLPQVAAGKGPLRDFKKRQTTAKQAEKVEDGPDNPFTLRPLSRTYFDILKKRRDLPVHAQRYRHHLIKSLRTNGDLGKNSLTCIILLRYSYLLEKPDLEKQLKFLNSFSMTSYHTLLPIKLHVHNPDE